MCDGVSHSRLYFTVLASALLFADSFACSAADPKKPPLKWFTLLGCRLMPDEHRDGDSFHLMTRDKKEFIFCLYFVDAPETDVSIKDRVKDQAKYFRVSQAEVIKAGESARRAA